MVVDEEQCYEAWEKILQRHSRATGDYSYSRYTDTLRSYGDYIAQYQIIKACLLKLTLVKDQPTIDYLEVEGYPIDTTTDYTFARSLEDAFRKSNNLVTKILSKKKELEMFESKQKQGENFPLEEMQKNLAQISSMLGFVIDDELLLSRYNEYVKLARTKAKEKR